MLAISTVAGVLAGLASAAGVVIAGSKIVTKNGSTEIGISTSTDETVDTKTNAEKTAKTVLSSALGRTVGLPLNVVSLASGINGIPYIGDYLRNVVIDTTATIKDASGNIVNAIEYLKSKWGISSADELANEFDNQIEDTINRGVIKTDARDHVNNKVAVNVSPKLMDLTKDISKLIERNPRLMDIDSITLTIPITDIEAIHSTMHGALKKRGLLNSNSVLTIPSNLEEIITSYGYQYVTLVVGVYTATSSIAPFNTYTRWVPCLLLTKSAMVSARITFTVTPTTLIANSLSYNIVAVTENGALIYGDWDNNYPIISTEVQASPFFGLDLNADSCTLHALPERFNNHVLGDVFFEYDTFVGISETPYFNNKTGVGTGARTNAVLDTYAGLQNDLRTKSASEDDEATTFVFDSVALGKIADGTYTPADTLVYPYELGATETIEESIELAEASELAHAGFDPVFPLIVPTDARVGTNPLDCFCTMLEVSENTLKNLSQFLWSTDFTTMLTTIGTNPKDCIISITAYPFTVQSKEENQSDIILGNVLARISGQSIKGYKLTDFKEEFDFGSVDVPHIHESYLDYKPYTSAYIYLPYIGTVPIDVNLIMGKSVHIKYFVEYMSGTCLVEIYASDSLSFNDTLILQTSGNIGMQLPVTSADHSALVSALTNAVTGAISGAFHGGSSGALAGGTMGAIGGLLSGETAISVGGCAGNTGFLGVQKPFIVLTYCETTTYMNTKTYKHNIGRPTKTSRKLSAYLGDYVELEAFNLKGINILDDEKAELAEILQSGFYV